MKVHPAILALSETRLIVDIEDSEISVPGYGIVRCDAENRSIGGVIFYRYFIDIRNDIKYRVVERRKLVLIYISPSAADGDFIRFIEDIVESIITKDECIVLGDFNIDIMTDSFYAKKIITVIQNQGMKQYVDNPTRIVKGSRTTIDLIFANNKINIEVLNKPKITDHARLELEFNKKKEG